MSSVVALSLSAALAYLIGSIPFSLILARRLGGIDLRQHGSGNVGATNVARTIGVKWGIVALLCDAAKGMIAVGLLPVLLHVNEELVSHQKVIGAVFAILGHMFSVWLHFRGGKGVATSLGAVLFLSPWTTLIAFVAFLLTFAVKRIVSLSSIMAAIIFAFAQCVLFYDSLWSQQYWSLSAFSVAAPVLILYQHRANLRRIMQGTEPRFTSGKLRKSNTSETSIEPNASP